MAKRQFKIRTLLTVIASWFMMSVVGFSTYWGNLFVYTVSYIRAGHQTDTAVIAPWVLPLWMTGTDSVGLFAGLLSTVIGAKPTLLCAIITLNASLAVTYLFIDFSRILFYICLGFLNGMGAGCVCLTTLQIVINLVGTQASGVFISCLRSSIVIGGVVINQIVTSFLNPDNQTPDVDVGTLRFFSQDDVIESVPVLYLVLGGSFCILQLLCFVVMKEKTPSDKQEENRIEIYSDIKSISNSCDCTTNYGTRADAESLKHNTIYPCPNGTTADSTNATNTSTTTTTSTTTVTTTPDLSPREVIRTVEFYILSLALAMSSVSYAIVNNYTKTFGQIWISNDHFLTIVWNVNLVALLAGNLAWGVSMDRFGIKPCLVLHLSLVPVLDLLLYFTPRLSPWLFCLTVWSAGAVGLPLYVIFSISAAKSFGHSHFSSNMGMMCLFPAVVNLAVPPLLRLLLEHTGWFYVFGLAASLCLIALVLVILKLPHRN